MSRIKARRLNVNDERRITDNCRGIDDLRERMSEKKNKKSWYTIHCEQEKMNRLNNREQIHEQNKKRLKEVLGI